MSKIERLRKEREAELQAAETLAATAQEEDRDLSDEEVEQIESHTARAKELAAEIEEEHKAAKRRADALAAMEDARDWGNQTQEPIISRRPDPSPRGQPRIVGGEASGTWSHFGEFMFQVRRAGDNYANPHDARLRPEAAAPGWRSDVDSLGGFLIPDEFRAGILDRVYATGELLARVKASGIYMSLAGNTLKIPRVDESSRADGSRLGGVRGYWVGETASITDSKGKVGLMTLNLHKAGALGYVTEEMLADSPAAGAFLERAFVNEVVFTVENSIVNGNGSNKPLGLIAADCAVSVTKETNQTAATVWGPNITKMWARMWAPSRRNAVWLVNQSCEPYLFSLTLEGRWGSESTSVAGVPLYYPAGSLLNQGDYGILMGRPVIPVEYCQAVGTLGDIILWDPSQYVIVDKAGGPQTASSMHVRFTTDEQTFRVTYRVDGQPTWASAMTPYDAGNSLSPIVLLAARS